jgi:hypothetical protein
MPERLRNIVVITSLVLGVLLILSSFVVWVIYRHFGTAGFTFTTLGTVLVGLYVWSHTEIVVGPFKVMLKKPAETMEPIYFDRVLPRDLRVEKSLSPDQWRPRAITPMSKRWPNSSTIRVRFMGGTAEQHASVVQTAKQWTEYANLQFEYTDVANAEIRVAFEPARGSWSYVGTDCLDVPYEAPTMNLAIVDPAVILHQFGRAIGLQPEHQLPEGGIAWNEEEIIRDLSGPPNYWDEETTRRLFLEKYSHNQYNGPWFDPESVMLLPIPAKWVRTSQGSRPNDQLSDRDTALAQEYYPMRGEKGS